MTEVHLKGMSGQLQGLKVFPTFAEHGAQLKVAILVCKNIQHYPVKMKDLTSRLLARNH